ncbi:MAG: hypothetical protein ACT4PY_03860 [Armatimonadota bacterium]
MRRQALVATVLVMLAAGVVAFALRSAADATPATWSVQKTYFIVNLIGLALGITLLIACLIRRDLRRYLIGFFLIALVMSARLAIQLFPLSLEADILMVSVTLPIGLAGGALVIWEWQRTRTVATRAGETGAR